MIYNLASPKKIIMPVKGDLINLDLDGNGAKQYRVLSMNGDVAKVMAMYDYENMSWEFLSTTMGTLKVAKYEGNTIDTFLNTTWYNRLTSAARAAIVPESVVCDAWYKDNTGNPDYTNTDGTSISKYAGGTLNIGERNVFVLGIQDIIDYLNDSSVQVDTTAIFRNVNIWKMFWNGEVPYYDINPWLRSSYAISEDYAWYIKGNSGVLRLNDLSNPRSVRPALNLNLNQVEFSIVS